MCYYPFSNAETRAMVLNRRSFRYLEYFWKNSGHLRIHVDTQNATYAPTSELISASLCVFSVTLIVDSSCSARRSHSLFSGSSAAFPTSLWIPASCDGDAHVRNVALWYRLSPPSGPEDSFERLCHVEGTGQTKGEKYVYENICLLVGISSNATNTWNFFFCFPLYLSNRWVRTPLMKPVRVLLMNWTKADVTEC